MVEGLGGRACRTPAGLEGVETGDEAGARREPLPGRRDGAALERVQAAEGERVEGQTLGELVHEGLVRDRGLGHAEAAEGACGGLVGVDGARRRPHGRHLVRPARVHRHAVGDRRAPRGIGAGIEVAVELE